MAVKEITLQPSADIHLVLQPAAQATLKLDVLSHDDAIVAPTSVLANCTFTIANTAIATVSAAGVLTPVVVGRTFLTVTHTPTPPAVPKSVVARVSVHPSIGDWWLGNNHGSVHAGEADLLLSAYALFDGAAGGNIGDITGHGYATFTSLSTNATVDAAGRVTGVTAGDATIRGTLDGTDRDVVVTVLPAPSTLRPIVEPVRLSGPMDQRRNVLFLAEGFKDRAKFAALVQKVVDRLVSNIVHEPFHILRDDVNYWMAFEPSHENGLTPGPPVNADGFLFMFDQAPLNAANFSFHQLVATVGLPDDELAAASRVEVDTRLQAEFPATYDPARLETHVFDHWQTWAGNGILQARDSRYGLMYASRLGDRTFSATPPQANNSWYFIPTSLQELSPDPRRSPPNVTRWNNVYFELLSALRTKKGETDPSHVIGPRWARDGDDQALVVFLCNDEVYGSLAKKQIYSAVAVDLKMFFSKIIPGGVALGADHEPDTTGSLAEALVATVAHELGHQFFLGDEYEGGPNRTTIVPAEIPSIELDDNLTTLLVLTAGGSTPLNPDLIKWSRLLRITRASRLAGPAVDGPGANILLPLAPGEGKRWKAEESVFVRTRNINLATNPNTLFNSYPLYRRHAVRQRSGQVEDVTGDVVTVSGGKLAADEAYPAGSTLFIAKRNKAGTGDLGVVLPGVMTFMSNPPSGPPPRPLVDKGGQCVFPGIVLTLPPPVPGIVLTADDRPRVIGLYEGGGTWNCAVFRPAPVCKMKDHVWPRILKPDVLGLERTQRRHFRFCFVCRYTIVNEVNPRRHPDLDALYPGREA